MIKRPKLEKGLDPNLFKQYYYLKDELVEFCKKEGLQTTGGKIEIANRIIHYLETGERLVDKKTNIKSTSYTGDIEIITLDSKIENNFKCTEKHRAFFKQEIGDNFKFNVPFQKWLKENTGKTYQDAIYAYYDIQKMKKTKKTTIDSQFEYNTYIRDFFNDNKGRSLKEAIICWNYKKSLPGDNKYEKEDLKILSKRYNKLNEQSILNESADKSVLDKNFKKKNGKKFKYIDIKNNKLNEQFLSQINKLNTPEKLSSYMKANIKYGYLRRDTNKVETNDFDNFYLKYSLMSPKEVYESGVGICWDQTLFEKYVFDNIIKKYDYKIFFLQQENINESTHTFLVYTKNNKYYYFENAFEECAGIKEFKSYDEAISYVADNIRKSEGPDNGIYVNDLGKSFPKINSTCKEFSTFCQNKKELKMIKYTNEQSILNESNKPLYFYHLAPKGINKNSKGLYSLQYLYDHKMYDLFDKYTDKYRYRICYLWGYSNKNPYELTREEVIKYIKKFRDDDQLDEIYFFRFPPYYELGDHMKEILKNKDIYRININDESTRRYIKDIYWGTDGSHSDSAELNRDYYENINQDNYFKNYDDKSQMNFASLNHISVRFKNGYCPFELLTKVRTPNRMINEETSLSEGIVISNKDTVYNLDKFISGEVPILFISGMSGSGKSYLGKKMAEEYNAEYIEMDMMNAKLKKIYGEKFSRNRNPEFYVKTYIDLFKDLVVNQNKRLVVEGVQICSFPIEFLSKFAIYILGTSYVKSTFRAIKRQFEPEHRERYGNKFKILFYIKGNITFYKNIKELNKKVKSLLKDNNYIQEGIQIREEQGQEEIRELMDNTPMNRIWFTSDLHFHKLEQDQYDNKVKESRKKIKEAITKQNKKVKDNDLYIVLGDIAHRRNQEHFLNEIKEEYNQMKGIKILVKGNHDTLNNDFYHECGFDIVVDSFVWKNYVFTHQPIPVEGDTINIHGHIHEEKTYINMNWKNHINVFCEYYNNYPVSFTELLEKYEDGFYTGRTIYNPSYPYYNKMEVFKDNMIKSESLLDYKQDLDMAIQENKKIEVQNIIKGYKEGTISRLQVLDKISDLEKSNVSRSESIIDRRLIDSLNDALENDGVINIEDIISEIPFFTPSEMEKMGVYGENNFYGKADNTKIRNLSTKEWFDNYKLFSEGFITDAFIENQFKWINTLNELYVDFDIIKKSKDINKINSRKQSILELGWNPEIDFNEYTRKIIYENNILKYKDKYNIKTIDLIGVDYANIITESEENKLYPVYILITFTKTAFGKIIRKATHGKYTHAAISLDASMNNLFSFNADNSGQSGFTTESLKRYNHDDECIMCVHVFFVDKIRLRKIKTKLDWFLLNKKSLHYSYLNCLTLLFNKVVELNNAMICSQFVDFLMKDIDVDVTHKPSPLVSPNDFYKIDDTNKNIYKVYEGPINKYNYKEIEKLVSKLQKTSKPIVESYIPDNIVNELTIKPIQEAKSFPIQFDSDGNLLIKNYKSNKLDINEEYWKSHRLLTNYEKDIKSNKEAMKYELAKLWFLNIILESEIYKGKNIDEDTLHDYQVIRARVLNDFNKYIKMIPGFNFTEYYNDSPFSDATIKIDKHTVKYSIKYLRDMLKLYIK